MSEFVKILSSRLCGVILTGLLLVNPNCSQASIILPENNFTGVVDKVMPAVVTISTTQNIKVPNPLDDFKMDIPEGSQFEFFFREFLERDFNNQGGKLRKASSIGSGFIIDEGGYIVTNYHVINDADEIKVSLFDEQDKFYDAKLIGKDQKTDLALLKIDYKKPLPFLKFADSSKAKVGEWVLAIGNPFGIGNSVTVGIISAKARSITGAYDDFIQIDASINRGNSGGPTVNLSGEVVGVNAVIISPSGGNVGIGLAIPANSVQKIISDLKNKGVIERAWLGVKIQNINEEIAKSLKLESSKGALVSEVVKGSPAETAGIKVADIIVQFDGQIVENSQKLPKIVGETSAGKKVEIEVIRDNKHVTLYTMLQKQDEEQQVSSKPDKQVTQEKSIYGMKVENLSPAVRKKHNISDEVNGVIITKVAKNSNASDIGLRANDIIGYVNRQKIVNVSEFETVLNAAKKAHATHVLLYVHRGNTAQFVTMSLEE